MRFPVDTGGTFTDLSVDDGRGSRRMFKASTTAEDPIGGRPDGTEFAPFDEAPRPP